MTYLNPLFSVAVFTRSRDSFTAACPQCGGARDFDLLYWLLPRTCHLRYAGGIRLPVNIRDGRNAVPYVVIWLVALGLLCSGCTTIQTESTSVDESLRPRMVKGASPQIFDLVVQCIHRDFPDDHVRSDAARAQIIVTHYSIMHGDAVLEVTVTDRPGGLVEVSASVTGSGTYQLKKVLGKFFADFDRAYADWFSARVIEQPAVE